MPHVTHAARGTGHCSCTRLIVLQAAKAYQQGIADGGTHPPPASPLPVPRFTGEGGGVKCYSQTDEDGILL
jgi:hypothetical protein